MEQIKKHRMDNRECDRHHKSMHHLMSTKKRRFYWVLDMNSLTDIKRQLLLLYQMKDQYWKCLKDSTNYFKID